MRVNPGNADQSYMVQKIQGNAAVGGRMPLGQAALPQDRIDLIRSWVAAGAPPAAVAPNNLTVTSVIPAPGEVAAAGLAKLTVVFARDVDATLASSGTFEVRDGFDQPVAVAAAQVPPGRPNVVELTLARALAGRQLPAGDSRPGERGAGRQRGSRARRRRRWCRRRGFPHVLRRQRRSEPMSLKKNLVPWMAALALLALAGTANAEPYLAAQMGLKCAQCHVNPTGGGMRSVFGNTFAQTTLAQKRIGSEEDLWTGQVMKFLSVGGNARANYNWEEVPNQGDTNEFDLEEARAYLDFGVIPNRLSVYIDQRLAPGNSTNMEANIRYWVKENAFYVKAGRMYLPFGYRFEDDNTFVRGVSGINMEAPDEGLELGFESGSWTAQVALSNGAGGGERNRPRQGNHHARGVRAIALARGRQPALQRCRGGRAHRRRRLRRLQPGPGDAARRSRLLRR